MSKSKLGRNPFFANNRKSSMHQWMATDAKGSAIEEKKGRLDLRIDFKELFNFVVKKITRQKSSS